MNRRRSALIVGLLISLVVTVSVGAEGPTVSHGGPVTDYASLVEALREAGATVTPGDAPSPHPGKDPHAPMENQGPFGPEGRLHVITVNEQRVFVHEFPTREITERAAKGISPDGDVTTAFSVDGTMLYQTHAMYGIDKPHFYKAGKLLVVYVGKKGDLIHLLTTVLGPQIAGR